MLYSIYITVLMNKHFKYSPVFIYYFISQNVKINHYTMYKDFFFFFKAMFMKKVARQHGLKKKDKVENIFSPHWDKTAH